MYYIGNISSDGLWHHGIKGQRWGVRNGPPYPLQKTSKKPADSKKVGKLHKGGLFEGLESEDLAFIAIGAGIVASSAFSAVMNRPVKKEIDERTGLYKKAREYTYKEDLKAVNPDFNPYDPGTANNCSMCTTAYDLRRRGYDVKARKSETLTSMHTMNKWYPKMLNRINMFEINRSLSIADVFSNMIETIEKTYSEDSRGEFSIMFPRPGVVLNSSDPRTWGSGHSMIFERKNGKTCILDGQLNIEYTSKSFCNILLKNNQDVIKNGLMFTTVRLDDLEPNWDLIKKEAVS